MVALIHCLLLLAASHSAAVQSPAFLNQASALRANKYSHNFPNEGVKIEGNADVYYCSDPETDLFSIERLDVFPSPPYAGLYATLRVWGIFREPTGASPAVILNVTGNDYHTISARFPLCHLYGLDTLQGFWGDDRSCPPEEGFAEISFSQFIYSQFVHDVNFTVRAEFVTEDDRSLFCMTGWVYFD